MLRGKQSASAGDSCIIYGWKHSRLLLSLVKHLVKYVCVQTDAVVLALAQLPGLEFGSPTIPV